MTLGARLARALALLVVTVPAVLLAASIGKYAVDVPFGGDQWEFASFFVEYERGTLSLGDLYAQQNEYRQFFPNLILLALGRLTHWRIQFELAASFLLVCFVFAALATLGARTLPSSGRVRVGATLVAGILIFSPVQEENWLWGIQLVYFVPIACVAAAIVLAYSRLGAIAKFGVGATLCAVSTFSSANGILAWVVTLPVFLLLLRGASARTRWSFAAGWAVLLISSAALYFNGYESPPGHPSLTEALRRPFHAAVYVGGFLGSPFGIRAGPDLVAGITAAAAGLLVFSGFVAACVYVWRTRDRVLIERTIGWIALGAYSIGTGIVTAFGRLGFGVGQSLASRYTTFSLYLSVGLVFLAAIVIADMRERRVALVSHSMLRPAVIGAAVALLALQLPVYALGFRAMEERSAKLLRGKACLLFINVVRDDECLADYVRLDVAEPQRRANELDRMGYLRPPLVRTADVRALEDQSSEADGAFESLAQVAGGRVLASGWAALGGGGPAHAVLLTHQQSGGAPVVFALVEVGRGRGSRSAPAELRWSEVFSARQLPRKAVRLRAWSFDANANRAFKLKGDHVIDPLGPPRRG